MSHTKTPGYEASKEQLLNRPAGIERQMGGDERMVGEGRSCVDVVGQITAAQAAIRLRWARSTTTSATACARGRKPVRRRSRSRWARSAGSAREGPAYRRRRRVHVDR
jgi:DNA-binding FrmR family transcriptional regulator